MNDKMLQLQTQINELSRAMYKSWSLHGETFKANDEQLRSLITELDKLIEQHYKADEKAARSRRLGY